MYSVSHGTSIGVRAHRRATAREALDLAEGFLRAGYSNVRVNDLATMKEMSLADLRDAAVDEEAAS
jgi:hypothetical protein